MHSELESLIKDITGETQAIMAEEPEEIINLYNGTLHNNPGSGGQYFGALVFAFADLRSISILYMGTGLLRAIEDEEFSLRQCKKLISYGNLKVGVSFLEYCGFRKLGGFSERLFSLLDSVDNKEDLGKLVAAFFNYIWMLYNWAIQKFPWGLGAGVYRKKSKEEFARLGERYLEFARE